MKKHTLTISDHSGLRITRLLPFLPFHLFGDAPSISSVFKLSPIGLFGVGNLAISHIYYCFCYNYLLCWCRYESIFKSKATDLFSKALSVPLL